ncbi:hypothetical protein BN946_scf184941.g28 [Trametes cinnabarina]|uniref:Pentatricopeptide repeat-containing protein-mitochondrial domain-containing protein n=1 Tax=Pycnoporus cinnabarinus TaxID=5643 RepID=A0A060SMQ8_PYCCI|nr:hypothetical protein BN946_scf184941.g28 [Trametes cinnabarina]
MLASSSRNALKRAQRSVRYLVAELSVTAGVQEQRRYASASQTAFEPEATVLNPEQALRKSRSRNAEGRIRGSTHTPVARYNMQMATMLDYQQPHRAMLLARRMKEEGVEPDVITYNNLLMACAQEQLFREARAVFADMLSMGIQPDRHTFHNLMRAMDVKDQDELHEILRSMESWGIHPNELTYEIIITRLARSHRVELALQFLANMPRLGLSPTLSAASSVITAAADLGFARLALELALSFERMSIRRLEASTWVDVLVGCAEAVYAEGVLQAWRKVVNEHNVLPDEGCCIQVLHTAARHGLPTLALEVIEVLKRIEIVWCEHHIAPVIEAMCHHNELKEAMLMLEYMRKNDIEPTLETATPILKLISVDTDAVDHAWGQLEIIREEGHQIDVVAFNVVVQAAIVLKDLQRAVGTYKAAASLGVKPNIDTYNLLLLGCIDARHRELGDRLLSEMKAAGIKPDQTTYERMVRLCLTQSTYEDAFFYLEEMKALGMVPPLPVYEALVRKLFSVGDVRYKLAVEEMKECGYDLSPRLKSFIDSGGSHDGSQDAQPSTIEPVLL